MARTEFHDDVHPEATDITGEREYSEWGQCVATAKSADRRCRAPAKGPHGKCGTHGGNTPTKDKNPDVGADDGNTNAVTHGIYVETNATYQQVLTDEERQLVDDIFTDYLEADRERHGDPTTGHEAELFRIAVSYGKHIHADNWAVEKPDSLESGNSMVDRETHVSETGQKYYRYKETVVAAGQARLSRDRRAWLKDVGLLEDPQSDTADAIRSLKDTWKTSAQDNP